MGKKLSASITHEEELELERLLFEDPELWYSYELLQAVISLDDVPEEFIKEIQSLLDKQAGPERLNNLLLYKLGTSGKEDENLASANKKYAFLASAIAFAALLLWFGVSVIKSPVNNKNPVSAMHEIIAHKGSKTQIALADGTTIWLNAGSKLIYPKSFSMKNREVYLAGEAYFKVVHNDKHPFVVHTAEADIKDLGTTFNVKAYAGTETTETTLIEGSVEVVLKNNPSQKILMRPKEKLVLHNQQAIENKGSVKEQSSDPIFEVSKIVPFSQTNDIIETAWVSDKLIFRNQRFEDLAKEMERRYNVTIVVRDEDVKEYQLTGIFKNESIDEALKLLQVIAPFTYKIDYERILITK